MPLQFSTETSCNYRHVCYRSCSSSHFVQLNLRIVSARLERSYTFKAETRSVESGITRISFDFVYRANEVGILAVIQQPPPGRATSFGVFATTTRISVDASLAGFIIGNGGVHSIQICHQTGVKLSIKEHETNPNLKNIELEGSFEQIAQASKTVEEPVKENSAKAAAETSGGRGGHANPGINNKTKLCDNFAKGVLHFWSNVPFLLTELLNCARQQREC
ncbi:hypothetical protein POTOM_025907 [Populus tomentosa]|uniref:K Homology domain-containing protein n=1 Tax=Populus tomentosa TaxID=118781 RepID=A0A8X7ZLX2_POPTO|nr:hypothetical protein POTOM_025907 [Populus tomentosa]